jgi:hypothetical protein
MSQRPEIPFDNVESALEYMSLLLEATQEARGQVNAEIERSIDRRKEALQLVSHKLDLLSSHLGTSRHILNDLRMLRRLLLNNQTAPEDTFIG